MAKVFVYSLGLVLLWTATRPKTPPLVKVEATKPLEKAIEGRIWIYLRTTGFIGNDRRYRFGETLRLENGSLLQVAATDLYVNTMIQYRDQSDTIKEELPSSLFVQARQGDQICFRRDSQLYRLTLSSSKWCEKDVSFDEGFKTVKGELNSSLAEFPYDEDIPENYVQWSLSGLAPVFLSPETKRLVLGQRGLAFVVFDALEPVASRDPPVEVLFAGKLEDQNTYRFILEACGRPKIEILIDRHHFYVHIVHEIKVEEGKGIIRGASKRSENFLHVLCIDEKQIFNFADALAILDETGRLFIDIPLIPKTLRSGELHRRRRS